MKKITLLSFLFIPFISFSQTTLFEDDFESYTDFIITGIGDWITLDLDGLPTYTGGVTGPTYPNAGAMMAYQIFNPSTTTPDPATNSDGAGGGETRDFDPRSGAKYAGAWAAVPGGGVNANDDWLISPVISLAASGNTLSFYVKALSDTYGPENYQVGVYVGTGTPTSSSDFTLISSASETAPFGVWTEDTYSLSAYDGQEVRIGIHCISADRYLFMVDDFSVVTSLSVEEFYARSFCDISCKDKIVTISKLTGNANYRILSLTGKQLINGETHVESQEINASNLASGIYIVEVRSADSNAVERKKIVIQ